MRDATNNVLVKRAISPVSVSDNTAQVSQIIDRQGYDALTFAIAIGSVADADATLQTPGTAPEAAASFQFDDDNEVRKLGYLGNKRYLRLTITPANNASAAVLSALALLSKPAMQPVVQSAS